VFQSGNRKTVSPNCHGDTVQALFEGRYHMAATALLAERLHEYPTQAVIDGAGSNAAAILDDCLNRHGGVLQLLQRYAGRTFCTPGRRLRLAAESYYPD